MIPLHLWNTNIPVGHLIGWYPAEGWNIVQCFVSHRPDKPLPPTLGPRLTVVRKAA